MQVGDLDEVLEIEEYSFPTPWERRMYENDILVNENSRFYVALTSESEIAGYIGTWFILDECHIGTIAVKREYRRMGIGKKLLGYIAFKALEEKVLYIILEVRENNAAAITLYEDLGFKTVGRRKGYYRDTGEDAHLMLMSDLSVLSELWTSENEPGTGTQ
ncbi:ribosomal protein S18-alanine N-acetyltransferase [bacterium]|nr:ribosomal protein S18-alanine N-acetyltransferase [bacterium]